MKFPWIKRNDLIIQPHDTGGWLIKDPVSLQYTLLSSVEFGLFQRMDGETDTAALLPSGDKTQYTIEDLESFLTHLVKRQLLYRPDGGHSGRPSETAAPKASPITWMTRLLSWYVPLGNPQNMLRSLEWLSAIAMNPKFIRLSGATFVIAFMVLALNFGRITTAIDELATEFTTGTAVSMLLIIVVVKLIHELGHALSAQHFGADCHEAGILFLFLTPMPFTNVTDSWKLPVHQRMIVTGAGMMAELLIASVCLILWSIAADGMTRTLLLQTALVCSVNTLLFNGNPLLRFDGYFLLSDFLRLPNLSSRSFDTLRNRIVSFVTARRVSQNEKQVDDRETTLLTYAILAIGYRVVLAFSILEAIHFLCSSNELEMLGSVLKLLTIGMLLGVPLLKAALAFATVSPLKSVSEANHNVQKESRRMWKKALARTTVLITALAFVCFVPLPSRIVELATVTPSEHRIFAETSGRLELENSSNGDDRSDTAWRLTAPESQIAIHNLQAELELAELQLRIANRTQRSEPETSLQELVKTANSARQRLEEAQQAIRKQSQPIKSPPRHLIASRYFREDRNGSFDEDWSGQPLSSTNLGAWIERGTTLGYVQRDDRATITVWVPQQVVQNIHPGQEAKFRLSAGQAIAWNAIVETVSRFPVEILPLNVAMTGEVSGEFNDDGFRPDDVYFAVTIRLEGKDDGISLPVNGVGLASIQRDDRSIAARFYEYLRRTFLLTNEL